MRATQSALLALIIGRETGPSAPRPDSLIVGDARASAEERLAVYAFMYRARIVEALEAQFPRLAMQLGPEPFAELGAAYIADHPSTHPSLRFIGEHLPAWLAARRPDERALAALAALEWARTDVFDLVDEPTLTFDALRAWPEARFGELPLRLVAAHRLVSVPAGTAALWDALGGEDQAASAPPLSEEGSVEALIVWREETAVYHRVIDDAEHAALALAAQGTLFGAVCDGLLASLGEAAAVPQAFAWLSTWAKDALLVALG